MVATVSDCFDIELSNPGIEDRFIMSVLFKSKSNFSDFSKVYICKDLKDVDS